MRKIWFVAFFAARAFLHSEETVEEPQEFPYVEDDSGVRKPMFQRKSSEEKSSSVWDIFFKKDRECQVVAKESVFEVRGGYFFFINNIARDIYGNGTADIEIEADYFYLQQMSIWADANTVWASGTSTGTTSDPELLSATTISMATFSAGVKLFHSVQDDYIRPYVGVGLTGAYAWFDDMSPSAIYQVYSRPSAGCVAKLGFLIGNHSVILIDLFFDYYFQPFVTLPGTSLANEYVDIGGFRAGAGLGFVF